jgi:hypothetical protein
VKAIKDKMVALKAYARQVQDQDMERCACEIRLRAEDALGERLKEAKKSKLRRGPGGNVRSSLRQRKDEDPRTLKELGITEGQSMQYQQMAAISKEEFERRLEYVTRDPRRASTEKILKPIPKFGSEPKWSKRENICSETSAWLDGVKHCEPIDKLRTVKPTGGFRTGIQEELAIAETYMAGLMQLRKEGII